MEHLPDTNDESIAEKALNVLECPVCLDYMIPPIKQCIQGHSLCQTCHNKCENCPCCRSRLSHTRNIALESLASSIPLPCPNATWGCSKLTKAEERIKHKEKCQYKAITCKDTTAKCSWTGSLEQFKDHYCLPSHFTLKSGSSLTIVDIKMPYLSFSVSALDELFLYKQKFVQTTNMIHWAVQYIGEGDEAARYMYEVGFRSLATKKRVTFTQLCQSIYLEDTDLFKDSTSFSVSVNCISPLMRGGANGLKLGVTIKHKELPLANV